ELRELLPSVLNGVDVSSAAGLQELRESLQERVGGVFVLEGHERPRAPAVFEGRCSPPTNAGRVVTLELYGELFLHPDLVLPEVPEVILVQESFSEPEMKVRKPDLVRVIGKPHAPRLRNAVTLATDNELVQVIAFPAHHNLEDIVQIGNGAIAADQKAPPDERTDFPPPDMELVDFGMGCRWAHARRV